LPVAPAGFDEFGPTPLGYGEVFVGRSPSAAGRWTFELPANSGDVLAIDAEATARFDADIRLYDPNSVLQGASTSGNNAGLGDVTAFETGTYQLVVDGRGQGGFVLAASNRARGAAAGLVRDGPLLTDVLEPSAAEHVFSFQLDDPATIDLAVVPVNGSLLDTRLTLGGPSGNVVARAASGASSSIDDLTLVETGLYTVFVRPELPSGGQGAYSIELTTGTPTLVAPPATAPIDFGETLNVSLDNPGDMVAFSLAVGAAQVGRPLSIGVSQVTGVGGPDVGFDTRLRLLAPDGTTQLATVATARGDLQAVEIDDFVLPTAGTYTITVNDDNDDHTGSFVVAVSDQPVEAPAALPGFNTVIDDAIEAVGDVDEYSFAGTAGQVVTVERLAGDLGLTLFGPDDSIIAGSGVFDSLLDLVTLPADGAYRLRFEPGGGSVHADLDDTGDYRFAVWTPDRDSVPRPIGFGQNLPGQLAVRGDIVAYRLDVTAQQVGRPVSIGVSQVTGIGGPDIGFDTRLRFLAPDGATELAAVSTGRGDLFGIEIDDVVLPETGTYTIQVVDDGDNHTGSFTVGVSDQPIEAATDLPGFNSVLDDVIDVIGDVDDYRFNGAAGQLVTVERLAGGVDLTLFAPDGSITAGDGTFDSLLDLVTLPADGEYRLRFEPSGGSVHADLDDTGDYRFAVWTPARDPIPLPIGFGQNRPGQLAVRGDIATYSLDVTEQQVGRPVSIGVSQVTGVGGPDVGFDTRLRLLAPDATTELAAVATNRGDLYALEIDDFRLPAAGTYILQVSDDSNDHTGNFTVAVSDQPIPAGTEPITADASVLGRSIAPGGDVDQYTFAAQRGQAFTVTVDAITPGLDIDVTILDSLGAVRAAADSGSDSSITNYVAPADDVYTIVVEPGGGTEAGSLDNTGDYTISLERIIRAPNLVVSSVDLPTAANLQSGDEITAGFTVQNTGNLATPVSDWFDRVVLSANSVYNDGDDIELGVFQHAGALDVGQSYRTGFSADIPDGISGDFFLIAATDTTDRVAELFGEDDNTGISAAAFTINLAPYPDLAVDALAVAPAGGGQYEISWNTVNSGNRGVSGGWQERVAVSNLTTGVDLVNVELDVAGDLAAGETRGNALVITPAAAGRYQVRVTTDSGNGFFEFNAGGHDAAEQNNSTTIQFVIDGADLVVTDVVVPAELLVGDPVQVDVTWTVENQGPLAGDATSWSDRVTFSLNNVLGDGDDVVLGEFARSGAEPPGSGYSNTQTVTLPGGLTGTFYVFVIGDASNDVVEPDGEHNNDSAPASIDVTQPYSDLVVEVVTVEPTDTESGQSITVSWRVRNVGIRPTNTSFWIDQIRLSTDDVLDAGDPELGRRNHSGILAVGDNAVASAAVPLPQNLSGTHHIFVVADVDNRVFELDFENNNAGRTLTPITVTQQPVADLQVTNLVVAAEAQPDRQLRVQWTVANTGSGLGRAPWADRIYLSRTTSLSGATLLHTETHAADLPPGGQYDGDLFVTVPFSQPDSDHRIIIVADAADAVFEDTGEGNNELASGIVKITHPDLRPAILASPAAATSGTTIPFQWQVGNHGSGAAPGTWVDRIYLSTDDTLDAGDLLLGERVHAGPLSPPAAAGSYSETVDLDIPIQISGAHYLIVATDDDNDVHEVGDEGNNTAATFINITLAPFADLAVSNVALAGHSVTSPAAVFVGDPVTVTVDWTVTNLGTGPGTSAVWVDRVIASLDDTVSASDLVLAEIPHSGFLAVNDSYNESRSFLLPPAFQGRYHLFVVSDAADVVFENGSEANNQGRTAGFLDVVRVPYADLIVTSLASDSAALGGDTLNVTWSVQNNPANAIGLTTDPGWSDRIDLTSDAAGNSVVRTLVHTSHTGHLAIGESYTRAIEAPLPNGFSGTYFVKLTTGIGGPFEFVFDNNNTTVTSGTVTISPADAPDLAPVNIVAPTATPVVSGSPIGITWTVENRGLAAAGGAWTDRVRLVEVGTNRIINLGTFSFGNGLEPGKSYTRQELVSIPLNEQGQFRVEVVADVNARLYEAGATANNTLLDNANLQITLQPRPDLQVQSVNAPATVSAGGGIAVDFVVTNLGPAATTTPQWFDRVYLSLDDQIGGDDELLATVPNGAALGPNGDAYATTGVSGSVPLRFGGPAFVIVAADSSRQVDEFPQEGNNVFVLPIDVDPLPPADLVMDVPLAPDQAFEGSTVDVTYTVTNRGAGPTPGSFWIDTIWLTADKNRPDPRAKDILLDRVNHNGTLAFGESYSVTHTVRLPAGLTGQVHIQTFADSFDIVLESTTADNINPDDPNEIDNNNYRAKPITLLARPPPDLRITAVAPQAAGLAGSGPFQVEWTVENIGGDKMPADEWNDVVYLASEPLLNVSGATYWVLGSVRHAGNLAPGQSYTAALEVDQLSPAARGQYVIVAANRQGKNLEGNPDNNTLAGPTQVTNDPADLIVTDVQTPAQNFSGEKALIQWTVRNTGSPMWAGTRYWTDEIYFSADPTFIKGRATPMGSVPFSPDTPLGTGDSYTRQHEITLPRGIGGDFYIHILTNPLGSLSLPGGDNAFSLRQYQSRGFEDAGNNLRSEPLAVTYREPDLVVTDITLPGLAPAAGDTITLSYTVTNSGSRDTRDSIWFDRAYLSTDPSLDTADQFLGAHFRGRQVLPAGASYSVDLDVPLPLDVQGDFEILIFTDANLTGAPPPGGPGINFEQGLEVLGREGEYQDEGNNVSGAPLSIGVTPAPDLVVTGIAAPDRVGVGQPFDVTYTVANQGTVDTPDATPSWLDDVYLSRDQFLDPRADRFLERVSHAGGLASGGSYSETVRVVPSSSFAGPFYVLVVTDTPRRDFRGDIYESGAEFNNTRPSDQQVIFELPPPSDLQVDDIFIPSQGRSGDPIQIRFDVSNHAAQPAAGTWSDSVYLSGDAVWDIGDILLGRVAFSGTLTQGQGYQGVLDTTLPPVPPGSYRVIVRNDIFNQVNEGAQENNNRAASGGTVTLAVEEIQLGAPYVFTAQRGAERLFQVDVGLDQTLQVDLTSAGSGANELFVRFADVPTATEFDAAYAGFLQPDQTVRVPATEPGTYFVLVRAHSAPAAGVELTLLADVLPFAITDVTTDRGGDGRYVTARISGARFDPDAIVKLVRPGIAEFEPVRYEVIDATRIMAVFDFSDAPRGLYDVTVINPDGAEAVLPYRYLIERALPRDATIALGGPRVLAPGDTGTYGVTIINRTNLDTPYAFFEFGLPELDLNPEVFNLPFVTFRSNLRGAPEDQLENLPWAGLVSDVNRSGEILAPGYVFDQATRGFANRAFNVTIYEGLADILAVDPDALDDIEDEDIAFFFHIAGALTPLTRSEFIALQTIDALTLREAIVTDANAPSALAILAADPDAWVALYLAALEDARLLRPENEAPPVRESPLVMSAVSILSTGLLLGPAGDQIITDGDLPAFFEKVREWYGHDPQRKGGSSPPPRAAFDLGLSHPTDYEAFKIYVPYGEAQIDIPPNAKPRPPSFGSFFNAAGFTSELATMTGPLGFGSDNFVPVDTPLPYQVRFENDADAGGPVSEIRVLIQLDANLDPLTFRLGDIQLGDIMVNLPGNRGIFDGQFDFTGSKGFLLRINAGVDPTTNIAQWLIQFIDPATGEVAEDLGLAPNDADGIGAGFIGFQIRPQAALATGTLIGGQARVIFNTAAPADTAPIEATIDGQAPVTSLTVAPLRAGSSDYLVQWDAQDDPDGSGVAHVTVYVAADGGDFNIWQRQTRDTSAVFQGEAGRRYEFLALATDNAGNPELPPPGVAPPDDGSAVNLGGLPELDPTPEVPRLPPPAPDIASNPLFVEAQNSVPATLPATGAPEYTTVLQPFVARAFGQGMGTSHAGIGPMAIAVQADGQVIASGGPNRGSLFRFPHEGGDVLNPADAAETIATLAHPVFDLAFDANGTLWAATGGGPLLQLDAATTDIIAGFGDGLTQSLAVHPTTGEIYVSSGNGIEIFDPVAGTFRHYSDLRVGNLAFSPAGELWAAVWPARGEVVRFNFQDEVQLMLALDEPVDSIAFGFDGTDLEGLLFITSNSGVLTLVELASMNALPVAAGGTRGDIVRTTPDGRVLISQSHQIDVLSPVLAPRVLRSNPPPDAVVALPHSTISLTFDQPMNSQGSFAAAGQGSVFDAGQYRLVGAASGPAGIRNIAYDAPSRTVTLVLESLLADEYTLTVNDTLQSAAGITMASPHQVPFTTVSDFSQFVAFNFTDSRMLRSAGTISYDVAVTNTGAADLLLPIVLILDPAASYSGVPQGALPPDDGSGVFFIDLSASLPVTGRLPAGQSTAGRTITILNPDGRQGDIDHSLSGVPGPNQAPVFTSSPLTRAFAGSAYEYAAGAEDPDGPAVVFLLAESPAGMSIDPVSGLVQWLPQTHDAVRNPVAIRAFDQRGGSAKQEFTITVSGVNHPPQIAALPAEVPSAEGEPLSLTISAFDTDHDPLTYFGHRLPPGAVVDPRSGIFSWTPGYGAAGTYRDVEFIVSDGMAESFVTTSFQIAPTDQAPVLVRPPDRTISEGQTLRFTLQAVDPENEAIAFSSSFLPGGAVLGVESGIFEWTPQYFQAGDYDVPFTAADGRQASTVTTRITVLNDNAPPVFDPLDRLEVSEGQRLHVQAFAFDADNPNYELPVRRADGTLVQPDGPPASVAYTHGGLPASAIFDADTTDFVWQPDYDQAGDYSVTFTATDDGNGTGNLLSAAVNALIRVRNSNRAPVITPVNNLTLERGQTLDVAVTVADADGNPVTIAAESGLAFFPLPDFMTLVDHGNGTATLSLAPGFNDSGDHPVKIIAADDGDPASGDPGPALVTEFEFIVSVNAANEPPGLAFIGDKVALVGETLTFDVLVSDKDQDALTYDLAGLPAGATLTPTAVYGRAIFSWTPAAGDIGTYPATVTVTDSGNGDAARAAADSVDFDIVVRTANQAPILSVVGDRTVAELGTLALPLTAQDPDGDPLTYDITNLPAGAVFDPVAGTLTWTPTVFEAGRYDDITVSATDGHRTSSEIIAITVTNTNQAPVLTPLSRQTGREGVKMQFSVAANDADGDALLFGATDRLAAGAALDPTSG